MILVKKLSLLIGLFMLGILAQPAHAGAQSAARVVVSQTEGQASERRFTFADGRISFLAPPDFTALTAEEIALKFTSRPALRHAVGNAGRTTTILRPRRQGGPVERPRGGSEGDYEQLGPCTEVGCE